MVGIVFYKNNARRKETALREYNNIIRNYGQMAVKISAKTEKGEGYEKHTIKFDNGDMWLFVPANENIKGLRCNIAYIDREIETEVVTTLISPMISRTPYTAIHYF